MSVGFFDQFYFSRVFKRAKGVPPSKYFAAQADADPPNPPTVTERITTRRHTMPLQKNQILTLRIERLSSDGSGVAHSADGEAVFVPAPPRGRSRGAHREGLRRYAFGILDELLTPSPDRIPVDCAVAGPCGGCSLRHLDYAAELRAKQENVTDAFRRIGGLDVPVLDICPLPEVDRYRNKVQFPVG